MAPDCVDPQVGVFLREVMKKSIPENVADCWSEYDFGELWEARLHWSGCPACRTDLTGVPSVFRQIGAGLESKCGDILAEFKDSFLREKTSLLAGAGDLSSAYPEIIAGLATWDDVLPFLGHGQEVLCLRAPIDHRTQREANRPDLYGPILSSCREFISSLDPGTQCFVISVLVSRDLLAPVCEKMAAEGGENPASPADDLQRRMQMAIENSHLQSDVLFQIIELAAMAYSISLSDGPKGIGPATMAREAPLQTSATPREAKALHGALQEWKREFDDLEDSLKAGQMELVRLFERNSRPAASYEPYIIAQLGVQLYSSLQERTQRALQLCEYLYNINQEPDGFSLAAIRMAQGYENELTVRVIWPFVNELLAAGTQTYDAQGTSKEPLIRWGKVRSRGMNLGRLAWYLGKDPVMRSKISQLGFDADAVSKDAAWVGDVRNEAAHDFTCDRTMADDLRRRMLCCDGILSHLHPTASR